MKSYVISLPDREDRRSNFFSSLYIKELGPIIIDAVSTSDEFDTTHPNRAVAACWMSHLKVAQEFLKTDEEFALIFEDDAELNEDGFSFINGLRDQDLINIDCLQIGFNIFRGRITGRRWVTANRFYAKILLFKKSLISFRRDLNPTNTLLGQLFISRSFETGTHCYLMSRKLAKLMISYNVPVVVPADVALGELALVTNLNFYRATTSLCNQSTSPSSIDFSEAG
jgi:GR25 family glycosyltransferase involved in LPS biosynthesis